MFPAPCSVGFCCPGVRCAIPSVFRRTNTLLRCCRWLCSGYLQDPTALMECYSLLFLPGKRCGLGWALEGPPGNAKSHLATHDTLRAAYYFTLQGLGTSRIPPL